MIHGKYIGQGEDLTAVKEIRKRIFDDPSYELHEEQDAMALNALVDVDGTDIGTGRLILDLIEDRFYVDNIGIVPEERGKMYGEFTLRMLADKADQCNAKEIWAEVPKSARGFFDRFFFEEMQLNDDLTLMRAEIVKFHSCCSHAEDGGAADCSSCNGCSKGTGNDASCS